MYLFAGNQKNIKQKIYTEISQQINALLYLTGKNGEVDHQFSF